MAALQNIATSTAQAFMDNKALLGAPDDQATLGGKAAFNPNDMTALNTSDDPEAVYARANFGGEFHADGGKRQNGAANPNSDESREKRQERAASAARDSFAAIEKPWYEQAYQGVQDFFKDPFGSIGSAVNGTVQAAQKTAGEFMEKPLETVGNVASSGLNFISFGFLGESKEDIAKRLEEEKAAAESKTALPSESREERIAGATQNDVVNGPQVFAPEMASQFFKAISGGASSIDVSKPDQDADLQIATATPASRQYTPFG